MYRSLLLAALLTSGSASAYAACDVDHAVPTSQATVSPSPGSTLDMRNLTAETVIINNANDVCVLGPKQITGPEPRTAIWHSAGGHDGVQFPHAVGPITVLGAHIDNVTDAISPPKAHDDPHLATFVVSGVYATYIRDDFVEDDAGLGGLIEDTLVDGAHTFLSARPSSGVTVKFPPAVVTIRNTLAYMQCMPDNRTGFGCAKSTDSVHWLWKWSPNASDVKLDVSDSIFMVEATGGSGAKGMTWPAGTYRNVTLVWIGQGNYPGPAVPPGVTVTRDTSIWDQARADWLKRHGCQPNGSCNGTSTSFTITAEAEGAALHRAFFERLHAGFTGSGYIDYFNEVGSSIEWSVAAPRATTAALRFRYANGKSLDRQMEISVDGINVNNALSFPPTGGWTVWATQSLTVQLQPGMNRIQARAITPEGGPNVDNLVVSAPAE